MVRETCLGGVVTRDTATITTKAVGTVSRAGCASTAPHHPVGAAPNMVETTAVADRVPPVTSPTTAPAAVRPRHQIPSSSKGQKVEAATAKASSTACATASPELTRASPS